MTSQRSYPVAILAALATAGLLLSGCSSDTSDTDTTTTMVPTDQEMTTYETVPPVPAPTDGMLPTEPEGAPLPGETVPPEDTAVPTETTLPEDTTSPDLTLDPEVPVVPNP